MKTTMDEALSDEVKGEISAAYKSIKNRTTDFKNRVSQRILISEVARTLSGFYGITRILVAEAPTGTGKSIGYMLPAIPVAKSEKKRLIISTGTVALQEQLVKRDIPSLMQKSGLDFTTVLAKGRSRYACNRNIADLANDNPDQSSLDLDEQVSAAWHFRPDKNQINLVGSMFIKLDDQSWSGDIDDWQGEPIDDQVRTAITIGQSGCLGRNCRFITQCGYFNARANMDKADVIVANHDLVMSDINLGGGVILPPPEESIYIFDEAHHLPAVALAHGAAESSIRKSISTLNKLAKVVSEALGAAKTSPHKIKLKVGDARAFVKDLNSALMNVEDYLVANFQVPERSQFSRDGEDEIWRFQDGIPPPDLVALSGSVIEPAKALLGMVRGASTAIKEAVKDKVANPATTTKTVKNLGFQRENLESLLEVWAMLSAEDNPAQPPYTRWIVKPAQKGKRDPDYSVNASPTSSSKMLRFGLWNKAAGVVLTSATITSLGNFNRFAEQAGLSFRDGTQYLKLQSPFDYQSNAELHVPAMRNEPSSPVAHAVEVAEKLNEVIDRSKGTLVLFTSRKALADALGRMSPELKPLVLAQGSIPKNEILQVHASRIGRGEGSIIFGLSSFAEGVDLPGRLCEHVIITKLPFTVPTSPIEASYSEWLEKNNRNPFMEISVPDACTKLVQACGRLIRTESDRGMVTLLDRRIATKRYGRQILESLPPFRIYIEETRKIA